MYNPYAIGRWYRLFIESDPEGHKLTQCDIEGAEISGNYVKFPPKFHILQTIHDIKFTSSVTVTENIKTYADGSEAVILPSKDTFDSGYVYVFGHFEGVV